VGPACRARWYVCAGVLFSVSFLDTAYLYLAGLAGRWPGQVRDTGRRADDVASPVRGIRAMRLVRIACGGSGRGGGSAKAWESDGSGRGEHDLH
jgi:hypothetical protein